MSIINDNKDNIKVILRVRPRLEREGEQNSLMKVEGNSIIISQPKSEPKQFTYDFIATEDSTQEEIFLNCGREIADSTLQGYNGTIFVYGQTGAGKTYTLLGPNFSHSTKLSTEELDNSFERFYRKKEEESRGLLPRVIDYLFEKGKCMENSHISFSCSFLEIYQEQLKDLLEPESKSNIFIRDYTDTVLVEGLSKVSVTKSEEALELIIKGIFS
jgi:hypothetical protein